MTNHGPGGNASLKLKNKQTKKIHSISSILPASQSDQRVNLLHPGGEIPHVDLCGEMVLHSYIS